MALNGRDVGAEYKFGMNGQIQDREVFNGFMSADFWGYDSRLGRRWNVDPLYYSNQSPYVVFNNSPILFADPFGLEAEDQLPVKPIFLDDDNSGGGNANHKHDKGPNGQKVQLPLNAKITYFTSNKFKIPGSNKVVNTPIGSIQSFQVISNREFIQGHGYVEQYNTFKAYFSSETGDFIELLNIPFDLLFQD